MVRCEICESEISGGSVFTCSYCGRTFCPDHRLPFNHACTHIEEWRRSSPEQKRARAKEKREPARSVSEILRVKRTWFLSGAVILISVLLLIYFSRG